MEYRANKASYQFPTATSEEVAYRHEHWKDKRDLVVQALRETGATERQLEAVSNCGSQCVVEYCAETQQFRTRANTCKCRHCQPCAASKAGVLAANLRNRLETATKGQYRFVTLTLKHTDQPLAAQIARLYASWKKLRNCATWHTTQKGGAAILEVKWSPKTRQWHPHLHIVTEGKYLSQRDLSAAWLAATGDSSIVDIRALNSGKDAAHYVAKYVSKGTVDAVWHDPDARQEWVTATKGVRSAATFGTWRGFKLLAKRPETKKWQRIGLLTTILDEAKRGSPAAAKILSHLYRKDQHNPHRRRLPIDTSA